MKLIELFAQFTLRLAELFIRVYVQFLVMLFTAAFNALSAIVSHIWSSWRGREAGRMPRRRSPRPRRRARHHGRKQWQGRR